MDRTFELEMVDELLDVLANPTHELTDRVHEEPTANYTCPERFVLERERLFQRMPIAAALSAELPEACSWKLFDETGVPIVLIRGEDEVVRGFLNVCGHRGARLVEQPRGTGKRMFCPFHAWSYKPDGSLAGVPAQQAFAGVCREDRALRPVEVREHLGIVWVVAKPGDTPMDLDAHLGPFAEELAKWDVGSWNYLETRVHEVPANWKITMDTFTEGYHVPVLHKDSIGALAAGGLNAYRAFGDHQRQVFAMKTLEELRGTPREQWNAFDELRLAFTYDIYPNTTFLMAGDHTEMYQTFPGATVDTSVCVHSLFSFEKAETEEQRGNFSTLFDFFFNLVEHEDFRVCAGIQKGLGSGAFDTHIYGRNEAMTQAMHLAYDRDLNEYRSRQDLGAGNG
ncbi:MAG TPA: aromatic ring-hydroxylating dioxygenase subunit alpha [Pseudonocardia sp.]|nr:aromatic ring-hydroxylating dioxygenase subunit alpha [Pseudonocardia sp.]